MKNIPVLCAEGKTLASAYEAALVKLYYEGGRFKTQYDKPGDPESIDATMNITIHEPLTDPMIHKAFPGGMADLREYVYELEGLKDSWIRKMDDPKDTRWEYTYHQRLADYGSYKRMNIGGSAMSSIFLDGKTINQVEIVVNKLCKQPFTRQAQMITWIPSFDLDCHDPACLQSLWFRIAEEDGIGYLNTNVRFRSNDAWGAYFMNSFGLTMFIKDEILDKVANRTGKEIKMGRINWQADSWHVYGKDIKQLEERLIRKISMDEFVFEDRVYNFYDPDIQEMYHECEIDILKKIEGKNREYKNK